MGNIYKRLDLKDRCKIEVLLNQGKDFSEIGEVLGRHRSTISQEVTNHVRPLSGYDASYAQELSDNSKQKRRRKKHMDDIETANYVLFRLKQGWSPEGIAGRLRYEIEQGLQPCSIQISHETIYDYIYDSTQKAERLWQYLRYGKMRRTKHKSRRTRHQIIPARVFIDKRPEEVNTRESVGHWETDTIMYGMKLGINSLVERKTRYVLLTKLLDKTPDETARVLCERLQIHTVKTVTADNGIENRNHQEITKKLKAPFYFCHPYHSWEKGTNEHTNGMVRRYLPKHTDLDTVAAVELKDIEYELNNRPRKILGFKTPHEVLSSHYQFVALAT